MGFSVMIDWHNDFQNNYEKWENCGRRIIEENCDHREEESQGDSNMRYSGYCEECGHCEDSGQPMMNYGYPLEITPDDDKILKVLEETNCTVMYNTETDEYFIALSGGGMDLSQDIALAYFFLQRWIPYDLATSVSTQKGLSVGGKNWDILKEAMKESLENDHSRSKSKLDEWSGDE